MDVLIIGDRSVANCAIEVFLSEVGIAGSIIKKRNVADGLDYLAGICVKDKCFPKVILLNMDMDASGGWFFLDFYMRVTSYVNRNAKVYLVSTSANNANLRSTAGYNIIQGVLCDSLGLADIYEVCLN